MRFTKNVAVALICKYRETLFLPKPIIAMNFQSGNSYIFTFYTKTSYDTFPATFLLFLGGFHRFLGAGFKI